MKKKFRESYPMKKKHIRSKKSVFINKGSTYSGSNRRNFINYYRLSLYI